ncbi:hypothetical protein GDO86_015861 [Hymenochirus boettgeri]|uniref:acylphosphatase n=1 Tax=Hymenochirus boettgeri TaxID=247094 RepID=A0A8T2JZZ1_9PIPI|nr:hypothetical protein GDO86_015861 [Hymenochirus boettgeri]
MAEQEQLISVDYEVFGKVQGVFLRKYTQAEGKRLGLVGWVKKTETGTVTGQLQGLMEKYGRCKSGWKKKEVPSPRFKGAVPK